MINSKPKSAVFVERMGCDSAAFARQLCAVVEGNFRNILARARVSQLLSWLCLNNGDRNIAGLAVVITCDVGDDYWQLLLKRKELAIAFLPLKRYFQKNIPLSKEFQGESG
ncbi:hypothetical protein [Nostoc sp. WHI]|uniref:hypothetical protein n=1 Tax=Nostoc sp. WHI TaxID=2650611 RepID=UPI0018C7F83E|nr:hypothetical protein [Nostoc sp. WHI]MBG1271533.1 hypothetical protein [Nostoc sp. WHI]